MGGMSEQMTKTTTRKDGRAKWLSCLFISIILVLSAAMLVVPAVADGGEFNGSGGFGPENQTGEIPDHYRCLPKNSSCNPLYVPDCCFLGCCSSLVDPACYNSSGVTSCTCCPGGDETCLDISCNSNLCVHNYCRPTDPWDGDGFCDSHSGYIEPKDCCIDGDGQCYPGCKGDGPEPWFDLDCEVGGESTCGDGVCQYESGETCGNCEFDCGECPPPLPEGGTIGPGAGGATGSEQRERCTSNTNCTRENQICNLSYCPGDICGWCTICNWDYETICQGDNLIQRDVSGCGADDLLVEDCAYGCDSEALECFPTQCGNDVCDGTETCSSCPTDCGECVVLPPLSYTETQTASGEYVAGMCGTVEFELSDDTGIVSLDFCVADESVTDPSFTVGSGESLPPHLTVEADGTVYLYFNVTPDFNLSGMTIEFKVDKSWLAQNSLSADDIVISVFNPETGEWIEISATHTNSDDDYYYFEATLPEAALGLSDFAITTRVAPIGSICGNLICEPDEQCYTCPADCGSCPVLQYFVENLWIKIALAILLAAALIVPVWWILVYKKRKKTQQRTPGVKVQ